MRRLLLSVLLIVPFCTFWSAAGPAVSDSSPALAGPAPLAADAPGLDSLYCRFMDPGKDARPRVWWHWMNGNITKDGIRKDLEWMDRAGVVGFHNFDANMATPQVVRDRLVYMTPEWKDAFNYALYLADSLGFEVSVASSPGWSITGGPWVGVEDAEKKLVWRDTTVQGGARLRFALPAPFVRCGPYQDILGYPDDPDKYNWYEDLCVLAVRLPAGNAAPPHPLVSVSDPAFPAASLTDGRLDAAVALAPSAAASGGPEVGRSDAAEGYAWIVYDYGAPLTLRSLWFVDLSGAPVCLEADLGDGVFVPLVDEVPMSRRKSITVRSFDFPATEVVRMRIRALDKSRALKPAELSFSPFARVNLAEDKAGFLPTYTVCDRYPTPPAGDVPSPDDVVDLSRKVRDGVLDWNVPEGTWKVLRFGVNLLGNRNGPASPEATGLEVDKLDAGAVRRYYDNYLGMYQDASGGRLGSAIHCLMIDSYESGKCTWTPAMEREFRARRGYSLRPWLPVLTGMVLGSSEQSEQFLFDWRTTLGELIAEDHYDIVNGILDRYGMKRYTESHEWREAFTGDGMMPKRKADYPMAAMWLHVVDEGRHSSYPAGDADIRESSSVAHIYGQNICAGESFTVDGRIGERRELGAYQSSPRNLKPLADAEMAEGLNRFVIHSSVHQPVDDKVPGLSLGPFGQWFNRHETWAEEARCWTDYLSRSCYLLQQGRWVADVAYFYGEDKNVTGVFVNRRIEVPEGYNFDLVNADVLLNELRVNRKARALEVRGGRLSEACQGMGYRVLMIDREVKYMSMPVLRRVARIARAGVRVIGPKPVFKAGRKGSGKRFAALADKVWSLPNVREEFPGLDSGLEACLDFGPGVGVSDGGGLDSGLEADASVDAWLGFGPDAVWQEFGPNAGVVSPGATRDGKPGNGLIDSSRPEDLVGARPDIRFVHRTLPEAELYWLANITPESRDLRVSFRVCGMRPELWRADTGSREWPSYFMADGRTILDLHLEADDAVFVVFARTAPGVPAAYQAPVVTERVVQEIGGPWSVSFQPGRGVGPRNSAAQAAPAGRSEDRQHPLTGLQSRPSAATLAPAGPTVVFPWLMSYTDFPDDGVRHFSGTAVYIKTFVWEHPTPSVFPEGANSPFSGTPDPLCVPAGQEPREVWLDLGDVHHLARVFLNGDDLGPLWRPPYRVRVDGHLRDGANTVEIKVINSWANRLIADRSIYPESRITFTSMEFYEPREPLVTSGLLGPVTLVEVGRAPSDAPGTCHDTASGVIFDAK